MGALHALAIAALVMGQRPSTADTAKAQVEVENERLRVLRVLYRPHQTRVINAQRPQLTIALTPGFTRITRAAGRSRVVRLQPGTTTWMEPGEYAVENLSEHLLASIELEVKYATAPARTTTPRTPHLPPPAEPMPASLEPHHVLRYANQYLRVLEVELRPGEASLFHTHSLDVLYVILAKAVARAQEPGQPWGPETRFRAGAVGFDRASRAPYTHHLENRGRTTFHTLNIEFLRRGDSSN